MRTESKPNRHWGKFVDYLTSWDQYGVPVGLTFNGDSTFKTWYGAIVSIGLYLYMIRILMVTLTPVF